ncbi:MAG: glycosyl hydrolase [Ferruginibacter sp.]|nr:glycosyl hydrolase [Ferruginibacter sp.]
MKKSVLLSLSAILSLGGFAQSATTSQDKLYREFVNPGNAARPRVWWHWMNGNITQEGIRKDLLWMHRSGIGGFQNFDAGLITPQIVKNRLAYMSPEWKAAFRVATKVADSLKLEMAIAASPGWSETGGPWVPAKDGMKKLVWRELRVTGGEPFTGLIPKAPATTGPFQNLDIPEEVFSLSAKTAAPPEFYEDVAVVAYRLPVAAVSINDLKPTISSSSGSFTLAQLSDGDIAATNLLPPDSAKGHAWIQFEFAQPQAIHAVTVVGGGSRSGFGINGPSEERSLEASDDGINFRRVSFIPLSTIAQQTITIPATTAKFFRVTFKNPLPPPDYGAIFGGGGPAPKRPLGTDVAEVVLHPAVRINHVEEKAGFATATDLEMHTTPVASEVVAEADVIDLSSKMDAAGTFNWTPPPGSWQVIRFGYSLTGKQNHPASEEATGLEVDKLDATAVKNYFEIYLNKYKDATGGLMGARGLQYVVTDSYEAGQETWTPQMAQEFKKRRGYALLPWMPVLTGVIVKSSAASEQFLWDWRKTISELLAENHYDQLTTILAKYGMKRYSESHENGRVFIGDGMDAKRTAAVPMSAMWTPGIAGSTLTMAEADIRESASVAHIYGQNIAAAESLTAIGFGGKAWSYSPENLKPTADLELASGLNRFVIHTSAHQPVDDKIPGLGLSIFGQWFTRHETWANQANAWTDYLARSSYLLQQGKFVADVVYYYGEDNNITSLFGAKLPGVPEGYSYDFINADAFINLLSVKDGNLVTPSGMSYRLLVLDSNARKMSLPVLRKLAALVKAGATITGVKPVASPSLADDQAAFGEIINQVWGAGNEKVLTGKTIAEALASIKVAPDFTYSKTTPATKVMHVHRKLTDRDIYWINNRNATTETIEAGFRVEGKVPQIWHPETAKTEAASYSIENGITTVKLQLQPNDAVFVIFKDKAQKAAETLPATSEKSLATLNGEWIINFQKERGAPALLKVTGLKSWTENPEPGVKYFSGTATYTQNLVADKNWFGKGAQLWMDLGEVKNLAEVVVNGRSLGIVWKTPFRVDLDGALKPGSNKIEIRVTNLWVNRLIGDAQPGVTNKITYTSMPFFQPNSKLLPSGLLGPVKIMSTTTN